MVPKNQRNELLVKIDTLIDDAKCLETVGTIRWPDTVCCPNCGSKEVCRHGHDQAQPARQRYHCKGCDYYFDDLCGTIFEGRHQPLRF